MPLYQVDTKGSDKPRLINAKSEAAALKHAAAGQFIATLIKNPVISGQLVAAGAVIETPGEPAPADSPKLPEPGVVVSAAETFIGASGEPLTMDALFAGLVSNETLPDTPEARLLFDLSVNDALAAGTMVSFEMAEPEKASGGKK